jgi:hypothetical protein
MKRTAWAAAGAAALAALVWTAGLLHAQWTVRRAVAHLREEHLESSAPGAFGRRGLPSAREVALLGCRALPALIAELDPRLSPYYLCRVGDCVAEAADGDAPRVVFEDDPEQRRKAVEVLRAWWAREGPAIHQWWRFWTPRCRGLLR